MLRNFAKLFNYYNYIKLYKITFSGETAANIQGHDIINPKTESYIFFNEKNIPLTLERLIKTKAPN